MSYISVWNWQDCGNCVAYVPMGREQVAFILLAVTQVINIKSKVALEASETSV